MKNLKKEILESLEKTYCRLKPSNIEGVGVFAVRDIPKGVNPFSEIKDKQWITFTMAEIEHLPKEIITLIDDFFVIKKNGTVEISDNGINGMDFSYFLNNSDNPNMETTDDGEHFIALRDITAGEELTVAYKTYDEKYT